MLDIHPRVALIVLLIVGMVVFVTLVSGFSGAHPYQQYIGKHNPESFNGFLAQRGEAVQGWQLKRDGTRRGIVEVTEA